MWFFNTSNADRATITVNGGNGSDFLGGGRVRFFDASGAGHATLIANSGLLGGPGGLIIFDGHSRGGTARVEVFGNGNLDIGFHDTPGVTVGSIEGDGRIFLGANNLTVGSNNLSTTFSGVMQDGGLNGGTAGSLTKIGSGTLALAGVNTYSGNTNINAGVLEIDGSISSHTFVNASGTLTGTGTVNGGVTNRGTVGPGSDAPGALTISGDYTQTHDGTLIIDIAGTRDFSLLSILGNSELHGSLEPVLLDGFIPDVGDSFTFLTATSLTGMFSRIENRFFDDGMEHWVVQRGRTDVTLVVKGRGSHGLPDAGATWLLLGVGAISVFSTARLQHSRQTAPGLRFDR